MRTLEPSSRKADVDHLQDVGSETEKTGKTGTRELAGGTLEGSGCGGGRDDGANGGTSGSGGGGRLGWRGGGHEGGGERNNTAAGEGTLRDSDDLAGGGSVGTDRG